jgi:hypothetical protein
MKLKVPQGVGAVSFDGQSYPVVKGCVELPDAATVFLDLGFTAVAGAETPAAIPEPQKTDSGKAKTSP